MKTDAFEWKTETRNNTRSSDLLLCRLTFYLFDEVRWSIYLTGSPSLSMVICLRFFSPATDTFHSCVYDCIRKRSLHRSIMISSETISDVSDHLYMAVMWLMSICKFALLSRKPRKLSYSSTLSNSIRTCAISNSFIY